MATKVRVHVQPRGKLDNANTRFSGFIWGEHVKLRRAIEDARSKFFPTTSPIRLKVKL